MISIPKFPAIARDSLVYAVRGFHGIHFLDIALSSSCVGPDNGIEEEFEERILHNIQPTNTNRIERLTHVQSFLFFSVFIGLFLR